MLEDPESPKYNINQYYKKMYSKCPDTVIPVEMDPKVARTGQFDLNLDL